jgi:ribosomal protein S18 acetylase RimI-like enzyme
MEFARAVHHQAYRDVVEQQYGRWDEKEQDNFFAENWASATFKIVLCDGIPCGYMCIEDRANDIHVRELVILPEFQNRGVGSSLLSAAMKRARERRVPVRLGTLHVNRAANLYRRLGFQETGRTEIHILFEWNST